MSNFELVELEPVPGRRVPIDRELTIGRLGCDVTVSDAQTSRRHASVSANASGAEVKDLGSRNGTFVNEGRVAGSQAIQAGDKVRVGETTWEVVVMGAGEETELAAPRGDVPVPPSGVREIPAGVAAAAPAAAPAAPPAPQPPAPAKASAEAPPSPADAPPEAGGLATAPRPRASAARRVEATVVCYIVLVLTAAAIVIYLAAR